MMSTHFKTFLAALGFCLVCGCGSTTQLSSSWNDNIVTIDGSANEWGSSLAPIQDTHISFGVRNDGDFVYICLQSQDQPLRRLIMGAGLTVWFESEKGEKLGIRYPIGMMMQGRRPPIGDMESDERSRETFNEESLRDPEVLGPGKEDRNLFSTLQSSGIRVKIGGSRGTLVYELKVPMKKSAENPYAIGAESGSTVRVNIETGKLELGTRPGGMGEGMRGGRPPGGGGPPEGGRRAGRPDGGRGGDFSLGSRPEPVQVSLEVHLSSSGR